jgi:hypothetical protein
MTKYFKVCLFAGQGNIWRYATSKNVRMYENNRRVISIKEITVTEYNKGRVSRNKKLIDRLLR